MKQRVDLNKTSILSTLAFVVIFVAFIIFDKQTDTRLVLAGCFAALLLFGLFYMPMSILRLRRASRTFFCCYF